MTAEFGARLAPQVYASVFYDAGNVWATASAFNPTRLFRGAGFGVSLITPLGPLGLGKAARAYGAAPKAPAAANAELKTGTFDMPAKALEVVRDAFRRVGVL